MELPLVSILITSYNRASYIEAAIESALNQTYSNVEIIITDNCSTDGTQVILEKYAKYENVHVYINETNIGQFPNRNKAAMHANGKYLKYLDSDDLLYPHTISVMVETMENNPHCAIGICCESSQIPLEPFPVVLDSEVSIYRHYFEGLLFPGPGYIIFKKDIFNTLGGFENYGLASDNLLTLKIASEYSILLLQRDLYWWRRHEYQAYHKMIDNPEIQIENFLINKMVLLSETCPVNNSTVQYILLLNRVRICRSAFMLLLKGDFKGFWILYIGLPIKINHLFIFFLPSRILKIYINLKPS
jgi:glycosyltransferase involved in cell wall biosynthesis